MNYDELVDQFLQPPTDNTSSSNTNSLQSSNSASASSLPSTNASIDPYTLHLANVQRGLRERDLKRKMFLLEYVRRRNKSLVGKFQSLLPTSNPIIPTNNPASIERRRKLLSPASSTPTTTTDLVPCRLEIDHDGYKLSDCLLLPESSSPEEVDLIATQLCLDYDLPGEVFTPLIAKFLREQVDEFGVLKQALEANPPPLAELPPITLRIDIIVGLTRLEDRIQLALDPATSTTASLSHFVAATPAPPELSEEEFAPFRPLLLHNILEQLWAWRRSICFGGWHRDSRTGLIKFHDPEAGSVLGSNEQQQALPTVRRHPAHYGTFTPQVSQLSLEELDRLEASRERENRRKRRVVSNTSSSSRKGTTANTAITNNLIGTIRSPPRTLPTPTSYRGSQHRVAQNRLLLDADDDERPTRKHRK